ncbi:uroporphyrinogen-III synthase [Bordetella sp. FB-8]|uniref:uroporphyrinogen-III synthase n=1 Tax=Bordetella sp. FB-8 TaxID=1159870 RepID=UPI000364E4CA|nr:uroporphyrinogen-III synthase [Bordetella sp. FB-8]
MRPTVVLTRPVGRNEELASRLSAAGWQALTLPALVIEPLHHAGPVPAPGDFDLVVFVSGNAVRLYLAQVGLADGWPVGTLAATVGPSSARALREAAQFGTQGCIVHPPVEAPTHDSEALWQLLSDRALPRRALLVRGETGRDWLAERLAEAGVDVHIHALYRRRPAVWPYESAEQLRRLAADPHARRPVWLLTSIASIDAVAQSVRGADLFEWWAGGSFVVTHPRQGEHLLAIAQGAGQTPMVKTCMPADESIFQAITAD